VDVFSYPHEGYWLDIGRPAIIPGPINEFEIKKELFIT